MIAALRLADDSMTAVTGAGDLSAGNEILQGMSRQNTYDLLVDLAPDSGTAAVISPLAAVDVLQVAGQGNRSVHGLDDVEQPDLPRRSRQQVSSTVAPDALEK